MKHVKTSLAALALAAMSTQAFAADFILTSPDVSEGKPITAAQYWNNFGCTGDNARPVLDWSGAPEGTKSFAVTFYDQDAPTGSGFWHWVAYDIPAGITHLDAEGLPAGVREGNTDVGVPGYLGPCPPVGRKHVYTYTVYALDTDHLNPPENATAPLTGFFIHQHSLGTATLSVTAGPRSE